MFRQFSILHEAVHHLSHENSKINQFIGIMAGVFSLTPFAVWKAAHLKHHYWTGNLEQDPTFSILKSFKQSSWLKKYLIESTWRRGVPFFAALQHLNFWFFGFKNIQFSESLLSLFAPITLYAFIGSQLSLFNAAICLLGITIYFRLYEDMIIPQHVGLYSDDNSDQHPAAWDQPHVTRSWYMPALLEKYMVLNMNYHTEHHLFPDLPWHQLRKAHQLMLQEKENVNVISNIEWMKLQRQRDFAEVIVPIPSRKKSAA
jgi:fatty acid desaturase